MQIYVDPQYPCQALDSVHWQLKMLTCLLSQGTEKGIDLDDGALAGICELLRAQAEAVLEVGEIAGALERRRAA